MFSIKTLVVAGEGFPHHRLLRRHTTGHLPRRSSPPVDSTSVSRRRLRASCPPAGFFALAREVWQPLVARGVKTPLPATTTIGGEENGGA